MHSPRATAGHLLMLPVPRVGHLCTSGRLPGIWHVVSKPWSESRIRDGSMMEAFLGQDVDYVAD